MGGVCRCFDDGRMTIRRKTSEFSFKARTFFAYLLVCHSLTYVQEEIYDNVTVRCERVRAFIFIRVQVVSYNVVNDARMSIKYARRRKSKRWFTGVNSAIKGQKKEA